MFRLAPLLICLSLATEGKAADLYQPAEAVADVLSGPLEFVGRGSWFGMTRWQSCVYRNAKVVVVDVYCAKLWPRAFSVRIFSPTKGRVRIYLESPELTSALSRKQYNEASWSMESEPPPPHGRVSPPFSLKMTFAQLNVYAQARYKLYLPACFTSGKEARCAEAFAGTAAQKGWAARVVPFWQNPGSSWYQLIEEMRRLAQTHGVDR